MGVFSSIGQGIMSCGRKVYDRMKGNWHTACGVAGTVVGACFGGFAGASLGGSIGTGVGQIGNLFLTNSTDIAQSKNGDFEQVV